MTKTIITISCCLFLLVSVAQKKHSSNTGKAAVIRIPMEAAAWDFQPNTVSFLEYKSTPALEVNGPRDTAILKNFDFEDGTIEYDVVPRDRMFTLFFFRRQNQMRTECFYFRSSESGNGDAVQYAPYIDGVNLWDMMYQYQSAASLYMDQWNHVKLVVSGRQLRVYVNDSMHPVLQVPYLESDSKHGTLGFNGRAIVANLVVKPGQTEGLIPQEGVDITDNDPRYLRKWFLSEPISVPADVDFSKTYIPGKTTTWNTIQAERMGLINLTRRFGKSDTRRLVWLKTNIQTDTAQVRKINMGFSDDVWVLLNGKLVYVDKNQYGSPIAKVPDGRCTVDNATFELPLNKGDNELLVGVANNFYGWGLIMRFDKKERLSY